MSSTRISPKADDNTEGAGVISDFSGTRILFVINTLAVGGTEKHLASLSLALVSKGWDVTVYSIAGDGPLARQLESNGVKVSHSPPVRSLATRRILRLPLTVFHLLRLLLRERFAIVHFFLPEAYLMGAPLALLTRVKLRIMSRRSLNTYQNKYRLVSFIERALHSHMTAVIANSRSVARELEIEGVKPERLGLIYNGVDSEARTPASRDRTRAAIGCRDTTLVFIIVANLLPYKGHLDLVQAFGVAAGELPTDWRLLIVGRDDGLAAKVEALGASLGIDDQILFLGARDDVPDLLLASDIGLLSSHEEGFSNAVLEGMRAGLPMIVTDVGGNAEAVIHEETGLVVPARDAAALAGAILRLASDDQLRRALGENGRRRVEQCFTLAASVDAYEALYLGLLAGMSPNDIAKIRYRH